MSNYTHVDYMHDQESRAAITDAAERIAKVLLERKLWRTNWAVEVEGCVFKLKVEGYPKKGTPHWLAQQEGEAELTREIDP